MLLYYLKFRKNTENKNPKITKAKNEKIMLLLKCAMRDSRNWRFINE